MLIAKCPILYGGRQYEKGDALPGDSPLVSKWLENGVAIMEGGAPEAKKEPEDERTPEQTPETPEAPEEPKVKATPRKKK